MSSVSRVIRSSYFFRLPIAVYRRPTSSAPPRSQHHSRLDDVRPPRSLEDQCVCVCLLVTAPLRQRYRHLGPSRYTLRLVRFPINCRLLKRTVVQKYFSMSLSGGCWSSDGPEVSGAPAHYVDQLKYICQLIHRPVATEQSRVRRTVNRRIYAVKYCARQFAVVGYQAVW